MVLRAESQRFELTPHARTSVAVWANSEDVHWTPSSLPTPAVHNQPQLLPGGLQAPQQPREAGAQGTITLSPGNPGSRNMNYCPWASMQEHALARNCLNWASLQAERAGYWHTKTGAKISVWMIFSPPIPSWSVNSKNIHRIILLFPLGM